MPASSLPSPRPIDHLVIAVRDLDVARTAYGRLGFTVTPVSRHPFGTANALVQLHGAYLELLAVAEPGKVPVPTEIAFSFAAFNRDFLQRREGMSMLALHSVDAARDRAEFDRLDLPVYDPLRFSRMAVGPDGQEREVAFSVTFTSDARLGNAGFFTCQHHLPENFWWPEYQRHANGASRVDAAVMVAGDPADFHEFLTHFTGQHDMGSTSLGIEFDLGGGRLEVMTPVGFRAFFGAEAEADPRRFMGLRIAAADLAETRACLAANKVAFAERAGALVVPPAAACGVAVAFVAA